jgi:uncharacterized protein YjbJ (UPF0337 family)
LNLLKASLGHVKTIFDLSVCAMTDMKEEGEKDKVEGKVREGVGKITDDKGEQMKGKMQQAKGDMKKDLADDDDE